MTMPYGSTEEPEVDFKMAQAIPVHVASSAAKPGKTLAAEFGQWRTITVSSAIGAVSATPGAQRLLNRSQRRHRALVFILATVAAQPVTDGVILANRETINSGVAMTPGLVGGFLPIGSNFRLEVQAELWVAFPNTNTDSVYVTVCDEVYASDPESWKAYEDE